MASMSPKPLPPRLAAHACAASDAKHDSLGHGPLCPLTKFLIALMIEGLAGGGVATSVAQEPGVMIQMLDDSAKAWR